MYLCTCVCMYIIIVVCYFPLPILPLFNDAPVCRSVSKLFPLKTAAAEPSASLVLPHLEPRL